MNTKELILALAEHVHVFGDDQVLIDQPGDCGFRVTGVSSTGILQVVGVTEDESGNLRDESRWPEADELNAREYMLQLDPEPRRKLLTQLLADLADVAEMTDPVLDL